VETILHGLGTFVMHIIQAFGYAGVVLCMTIESACIPLPSEVIMPFSGFLASKHGIGFTLLGVSLAGTIGNVLGSWVAYFLGYYGGRPLIERYGKYVLLSTKHLHAAERWFARYGSAAVFIGRILPVIRTFISLPAGIAKMPLGTFTLFTAVGSFPWCFALAYVGYALGQHWETISTYMHPFTYATVAAVILVFLFWLIKTKKNR
jgi:membrane protein DedA with SNARE-associated domain